MRVRGGCACCGADRLLPGRDAAGAPICRDCAGITRDFQELLRGGHRCER
jgi:hypothetical protein